jgi:hypothetical protein
VDESSKRYARLEVIFLVVANFPKAKTESMPNKAPEKFGFPRVNETASNGLVHGNGSRSKYCRYPYTFAKTNVEINP